MQPRVPALQVIGLSKRFGAALALDAVDLEVFPGEIHALVGENGAGKSTLINLLVGVLRPDAGRIRLAGEEVTFRNAREAGAAGVAAVFQELSVVGTLSVAENIFANRQPVNRLGFVRRQELERQAQTLIETFGATIDPGRPVAALSVAERQVVEILKALAAQPKVLLLDEPTSSLTRREQATLFRLLRHLRSQGHAILYISHHLAEVLELADRVTVLRDGQRGKTCARADVDEAQLVRLMVGRTLLDIYGPRTNVKRQSEPHLTVTNLTRKGAFEAVTFDLWPGEILGLAGLVGAGRTEVARALFGAEPATAGEIRLKGARIWPRSPDEAARHGLAYVTEDRKTQGLFLGLSLEENLAAPQLGRFSRRSGFMHDAQVAAYAANCLERYQIVATGPAQCISHLSGGNQQKALLAAWVGLEPAVLIVDEPTRGVDIGARAEIYRHLRALTARGTAVLLVSSDLQEILGLADRILVMRAGRVTALLECEGAREEAVLAAALGLGEPGAVSSSISA